MESLTETVLEAMKRSKRANMGGETKQINMIKSCQNEISECKNLDEIRHSLDSKQLGSTLQANFVFHPSQYPSPQNLSQHPSQHQLQQSVHKDVQAAGEGTSKQTIPMANDDAAMVVIEAPPPNESSQGHNDKLEKYINKKLGNFSSIDLGAIVSSPKKRHESLYSRHQHLLKKY